jgi:hypothetical protein
MLKDWATDDDMFVSTRASNEVFKCINMQPSVTVTGNPALTSPAFPSKYFSAKLDLSSEVRHNSSEFKLHSQYFKKGKRLNLTSLKICNLHVVCFIPKKQLW